MKFLLEPDGPLASPVEVMTPCAWCHTPTPASVPFDADKVVCRGCRHTEAKAIFGSLATVFLAGLAAEHQRDVQLRKKLERYRITRPKKRKRPKNRNRNRRRRQSQGRGKR